VVRGLEDVSTYPALFAELSRRGWRGPELEKLAGDNVLRVLRAAEETARLIAREGGAKMHCIEADVTKEADLQRAVDSTLQAFGRIDVLVNNAGIANDGALWRLSEEAWREVLDTNVTGAFNCIRSVAPIFRQQHYGKIVNISAHQAKRPGFGVANYAASKAALLGLTRAAAVELGPANVNVNAVAPGFIRTERMAMLPSEVVERAQKSSVLGRVADPEDVAHVISFLCSESARHITGQTIVVDGGLSLE